MRSGKKKIEEEVHREIREQEAKLEILNDESNTVRVKLQRLSKMIEGLKYEEKGKEFEFDY